MDIETFIGSVFLKKPLWDQKDPLHHNRFVLDKEWDDVAKQFNTTKIRYMTMGNKRRILESECGCEGNVVRSKWKSLRDTYRKVLHKMPIPHSGDDGSQACWKSPWKYFETLSFLNDQFAVRSAGGNLPATGTSRSSPEDIEESEESMPHSDTQYFRTKAEKENSVVASAQTKRKRPSDKIGAALIRLEERKMELLEKTQAPKYPEPVDDDISFFNSLLPFVRSLSPPDKLLCRMQIQELVYTFVTNSNDRTFDPQFIPVVETFEVQHKSFSRPTNSHSSDHNEVSNPSSVASYYSNFSEDQQ
uniref:Uncharacterized protein n=1 Tax=Rhodnius prolixus TaxID=13249 RepID=T1H7P0_RHOPR